MEHDYSKKNVAIIGAGASGCFCAYFLEQYGIDITLFDKGNFLRTLLPTGGGRCNLAHAEFDIKELAKNYPRGEKFLYSIFSKFSSYDTIETFEKMGIKTYTQENGRIFPESNSAKDVRETLLKKISKSKFVKEEVNGIEPINNGFKVVTPKSSYFFTDVVIAIGGHSSYELITNLGINIKEPRPSLVGLNSKENFKDLSGTVIKNTIWSNYKEDLLFTHFGISGPLAYTISSIKAFDNTPYKLSLDICPDLTDLQSELNANPHKEIKNVLAKFLPQKVVKYILQNTDETIKCHKINGKIRDLILSRIHNFEINITSTNKGEETVTAGGIDLNEINSKTMEVKKIQHLYCIGEVLNIDGFCGGFNLQNAWSTAYVCAEAIKQNN